MLPSKPMVFTKFPLSVAGANASFPIVSERPTGSPNWSWSLLNGVDTSRSQMPSFVAGYCVGQDLSDRELQLLGSPAQFSLGKSYENFAPFGPWLTTTDEIPDP